MTKKKGNASAPSQAAGTVDTPKLKKALRKDMRIMFQERQRIDKGAIASKYLALYPDRGDYIFKVLDKYALSSSISCSIPRV